MVKVRINFYKTRSAADLEV